jgi:hypothetical protein
MIYRPRSSNIAGIAHSIATTDLSPTLHGLRASNPEARGRRSLKGHDMTNPWALWPSAR